MHELTAFNFAFFPCTCCVSAGLVKNTDGQWHHICCAWENSEGAVKMYEDGAVSGQGIVSKGHTIVSNGSLVLGQEQDKVGGGFDSSQAYYGDLSEVNMWNKVLSDDEISRMANECYSGEGNVFKWSDFKSGVKGDAKVVEPSSCKP